MILAVLPVPVLLPLQGAFAVLRLSHACDWSWWLVTSPGLAVAAVWAVAGTAGAWWAFAARGRAWGAHGGRPRPAPRRRPRARCGRGGRAHGPRLPPAPGPRRGRPPGAAPSR